MTSDIKLVSYSSTMLKFINFLSTNKSREYFHLDILKSS